MRDQADDISACRRRKQTKTAGGNEMEAVRNYFNTEGFGRWQKIYGDKDDVSPAFVHESFPLRISLLPIDHALGMKNFLSQCDPWVEV